MLNRRLKCAQQVTEGSTLLREKGWLMENLQLSLDTLTLRRWDNISSRRETVSSYLECFCKAK